MKKLSLSPKACLLIFVLGGMLYSGHTTLARLAPSQILHLQIPILGTSLTPQHLPMGLVSNIVIDLFERRDQGGLRIQFHTEPGQFSLLARKSIHQANVQMTGGPIEICIENLGIQSNPVIIEKRSIGSWRLPLVK